MMFPSPRGAALTIKRALAAMTLVGLLSLNTAAPSGRGAGNDRGTTATELDDLVRLYGRLIFRVAFAVTRNAALAEDVVQDTLFKAWTSLPPGGGDVSVRWLRTVARNGAISLMRKESRSIADSEWDVEVSTAPGTERVVEARSLAAAMLEALAELDEASRTMIVMRETDDLSYEEIGELLHMTPGAVKTKLYRARHQLKAKLRDWDL